MLNVNLSGSTLTFFAAPDAFGFDFISICADDPTLRRVCDGFLAEVRPINDPPRVIAELGSLTIDEDEPNIPAYQSAGFF